MHGAEGELTRGSAAAGAADGWFLCLAALASWYDACPAKRRLALSGYLSSLYAFYACLLQWQLIACGFAGVPAELVIGTAMKEDFQVTAIPGNAFSPGKTCGSCLRLAFTMYTLLSPPTNCYEPQLHWLGYLTTRGQQ